MTSGDYSDGSAEASCRLKENIRRFVAWMENQKGTRPKYPFRRYPSVIEDEAHRVWKKTHNDNLCQEVVTAFEEKIFASDRKAWVQLLEFVFDDHDLKRYFEEVKGVSPYKDKLFARLRGGEVALQALAAFAGEQRKFFPNPIEESDGKTVVLFLPMPKPDEVEMVNVD